MFILPQFSDLGFFVCRASLIAMAFWSRLRQSKLQLNLLPTVFKRCYTLNNGPISANQHVINRASNKPGSIVQARELEFHNVRFYARKAPKAPFQKKEDKEPSRPNLNEEITAPMVRLVTDDGHFVITRYEAMARAKSLGDMDLVEVDKQANPPVCKIFNYNKQKYAHQTKEKELAKRKDTLKTGSCKEVRFATKINHKDLKMKADLVKRLLESRHRVKCTAIEPTEKCDLATILSQFRALIKDFAIEESAPKVEIKQAFVVVRHVRFGPAKSGSAKKAPKTNNEQSNENVLETEHANPEEQHSDEDKDDDEDEDEDEDFDIIEENGHQPKSQILEPPARNPTVNRYARDPTAGKPSRFPNQAKESQFSMNNGSPQARPNRPYEAFNQDSPGTNIPNSPPKGYGMFGGKQANNTPNDQNAPGQTNRYKKTGPSDSARNPTTTDSWMNRGPGVGNPRGGRR